MKKISGLVLTAIFVNSTSAAPLPTFTIAWSQPMARVDGSPLLCEDLKQFTIYVKKPMAADYVLVHSLSPVTCPNSGRWVIEYQPEQTGTYAFTGTTQTKDGALSIKALKITKEAKGSPPNPLILKFLSAPASPTQ